MRASVSIGEPFGFGRSASISGTKKKRATRAPFAHSRKPVQRGKLIARYGEGLRPLEPPQEGDRCERGTARIYASARALVRPPRHCAHFEYTAFPEVTRTPLLSSVAILSQLRLIDAKRLRYKIGTVTADDFADIREKIRRLV